MALFGFLEEQALKIQLVKNYIFRVLFVYLMRGLLH